MVGKDLIMATLFGSGGGSSGGGGWPEVPDDGATYLYITLPEGRTSPMLGVGVNGTVTVDWGDGTEPDVLTGTSISTTKWTPNHAYDAPGNYVIRLTVNGEMAFTGVASGNQYACVLRFAPGEETRNAVYQYALKQAQIGANVKSISTGAFYNCGALASVVIPEGVTKLGTSSFATCYALASVVIPEGVTELNGSMFYNCGALASVVIPGSVTKIASNVFNGCCGMAYYNFTACTSVPNLASAGVFNGIPADCEIRVPAALYDEWIAATNWATYADYIKAY